MSTNSRAHIFKIVCMTVAAFGGMLYRPNNSVRTITYRVLIIPQRYYRIPAMKILRNMFALRKIFSELSVDSDT